MTATDQALLDTFAATGVVKLTGVFSEDDAARMRDAVWRDLFHTDGVRRDDPSTWHRPQPLRKLARAKRDPSFAAMLGAPLRDFADAALGGRWTVSTGYGNLLVSFPDVERWHLPGTEAFWHCDSGSLRSAEPLAWLHVFAVFGDVAAGGGGTLLVGGSHRIVTGYLETHPDFARQRDWRAACFASVPWLAELVETRRPANTAADVDEARRRRFMDDVNEVDGIPLLVHEACGVPGDVYVCHPFTIHCKPPNASDRPRFLRAPTLTRADEIGSTEVPRSS